MKLLSFIAAFLLVTSTSLMAKGKQVDTSKSKITWTGKKVTGEHTGHITISSGELEFKGGNLTGGKFEVDMSSITCTDLSDAGYNKKLVGHLKSDDFFGVEKFPTSTLELTSVEPSGDEFKVVANLTIKDITHPVEFQVSNSGNVYKGKVVVDRTKYDVRYSSGKFFENLGDKLIYDDFELDFNVYVK